MDAKLGLKVLYELRDIHIAITKGHTGGAKEFAQKLNLTTSTFNHRLDALKSLGADILYDRIYNSYYYTNDFEFDITIKYKK